MILQALTKYYANRVELPDGYQKKEIPFIITLDSQGRFVNLLDTRTVEGKIKRSRVCVVPREIKRSGSKAWEKANLLWDTPAYAVGISSKDAENAKRKHASFIKRFKEVFPSPSFDKGIAAVSVFLSGKGFEELLSHSSWPTVLETDGYLSFKLDGDERLICERSAVKDSLSKSVTSQGKTSRGVCLVSGEDDGIAQLHNVIKGVRGAQSMGANIVSFNLAAFESFGKGQGYNAPIGKKTEFAYVTALNGLLDKDSRQKMQVGDATTVFWAEKAHDMEKWFADFFGEPPKGQSEQDSAAIKAIYEAPKTGAVPLLDDKTSFYVLGLAPNASRIAIRFWYQGSVGEVSGNIKQHFDDIAIVHAPKEPEHLSLFRLLVSTAVQGKSENIQPNLAGEFMKTILTGAPYPQTLLSAAISRIRAEQAKKDQNGKSMLNVTYSRAALIKAILTRRARYSKQEKKEVGMSLDTSNENPGYLLGRLFAVLERAQEQASPGINATIRDRFYGAASSTPVAVFAHLMKLKNHHIAKIDNKGMAINLEKQIGEIVDKLVADNAFPAHLPLDDQGRFAVGYYHQRQSFFIKKSDESTKEA
ncbi:MAG: type I-C CRISPR-associated protein Cas8c/Csd1 [Nitrospirae bacterium]|nr:type I-C CRISPR-associated protein Cas8c/Csd1 [Nitrospirota bacterium]